MDREKVRRPRVLSESVSRLVLVQEVGDGVEDSERWTRTRCLDF